jgi:hypothetical protein
MLNTIKSVSILSFSFLFYRLLCMSPHLILAWEWGLQSRKLKLGDWMLRRTRLRCVKVTPQLLGKAHVPCMSINHHKSTRNINLSLKYIKWWVLMIFDAIRCSVSLSSLKPLKRLSKLVACLASASEYHTIFYRFQRCGFGSSTVQELLKSTSLGQKVAQRWEVRMQTGDSCSLRSFSAGNSCTD